MDWLTLVAPILTGVGVATIAAFDAFAILESVPRVTRYCKLKLLFGGLVFFWIGIGGFAVATVLQYGTGVEFFKAAPPAWAPILGGIAIVQGLRLDYFRPTNIEGVSHAAADKESIYRKVLRIWINDVYRGLVMRLPDKDARMLIRRGLAAAYRYTEIAAEFATWADGRDESIELQAWLDQVKRSRYPESKKVESLLIRLLRDDLPAGRELAASRAPAIVSLKAF
jgi:hypothetical protein